MTSNQIKNREARNAERETSEHIRHNKREESLGMAKLPAEYMKGAGSLLKGLSSAANDPSWYNLDPAMVRDSANFSYHTPIGNKVVIGGSSALVKTDTNGAGVQDGEQELIIPAIMQMEFVPLMGSADSQEANPANIAARNIYSYVRHANSGHANYESNDLFFYMMSLDSILVLLSWGAHLYSALNTGKSENWAYPKLMVSALGFDPHEYFDGSVTPNDVRSFINQCMVRIRPFSFPKTIPLFLRHAWMLSSEFKDMDITKSQVYVFKPAIVWEYDESVTPGQLGAIELGHHITWSDFTKLVTSMIDKLVMSEDIGIMSGDILKAYGSEALLNWDSIAEDYHVEATYNPEVLSQIENATVIGYDVDQVRNYSETSIPLGQRKFFIRQDQNNGVIYYATDLMRLDASNQPETYTRKSFILPTDATSRAAAYLTNLLKNGSVGDTLYIAPNHTHKLVNMYKDTVTPDDNMVATRLTITADVGFTFRRATLFTDFSQIVDGDTLVELTPKAFGTEIILRATVFAGANVPDNNMDNDDWYIDRTLWDGFLASFDTSDENFMFNQFLSLAKGEYLLHTFDWAPRMRLIGLNLELLKTGAQFTDNIETKNCVTLTSKELHNVHRTAVYSEFGIPLLRGTRR